MQINARIDISDAVLKLKNGHRRLAFGVQVGLNDTAKTIQKAEFDHAGRVFEIRRPTFFYGNPTRPGGAAARITTFASAKKTNAFAEIMAGIGGKKSDGRILLPMFQDGGARPLARAGSTAAAVPITGGPARASKEASVPKDWTLKGLKLRPAPPPEGTKRKRLKKGEKRALVGEHHTFLVRKSERLPFGGIIERIGKETRLAYKFVAGEMLDSRLEFIEIGVRIANEFLDSNIESNLRISLAAGGLS